MRLPFSESDFLNLFGRYNTALWPVVALMWALTAGIAIQWWRLGHRDRSIFALLAIHWAWSGIVYHWLFFRLINPAAVIFGALFVVQAALFAWLAISPRGAFRLDMSVRGALGVILMAYGLFYPALGLMFGLHYPRLPLFAVPCPSILFTAGALLAACGVPRYAYIAPILWSVVAGSAALALGIQADLALIGAGGLLLIDMLAPNALGKRNTA